MRRFDHVVVGGGAAGAVLARRLADAGRRVALVEGGPSDEGRLDVAALDRYRELLQGPLTRRLPIAGRVGDNLRVTYPVADVLGGGTSLNTCVWFRPPPADFRDWEAAGAAGWGPASATPVFEALEHRIGIETVAMNADPHRALLRAAVEIGYPEIDFTRPQGDGVGLYRLSKTGGSRRSTSVVFCTRRRIPRQACASSPPAACGWRAAFLRLLPSQGGRPRNWRRALRSSGTRNSPPTRGPR